jgi:hypothetical protein
MWLWWSGLSSRRPSQQSGKFTWSSTNVLIRAGNRLRTTGQVGHFLKSDVKFVRTTGQVSGAVLDRPPNRTPAEPPHVQYTMRVLCG